MSGLGPVVSIPTSGSYLWVSYRTLSVIKYELVDVSIPKEENHMSVCLCLQPSLTGLKSTPSCLDLGIGGHMTRW